MWISSKKNIVFRRPDINFTHPLWTELRKYPDGFQIGAGEDIHNAPEWIIHDPGFDLHLKDGSLVVNELPGEPKVEWKFPEDAEGDPAVWRGLANEFVGLQRMEVASVPSIRPTDGLVAYSKSGGAEGSGSWELHCGTADVEAAFEEIATRAGAALGPSYGVSQLNYWLSQTWLYLRTSRHREKHTCGTETGACILGAIRASATHCSRLAQGAFEAQRNAALAKKITSAASRMSPAAFREVAGRVSGNSEFWKDRQAEFEKYAKQFRDLSANWNSAHRKWILWWGSTPEGIHIPQECQDVFNAIARKAVTELPDSGTIGGVEPWRLWLDFMRLRGWGFRVTGTLACTEREWDAGVKDGKALSQVRREQRYTTGDEWKKIYRRTKSGKLRRLSASDVEGKNSESLQKYFHWLENGTIERVFETSVRFCEDLSSRAFESDVASGRPGSGDAGAGQRVPGITADVGGSAAQDSPKHNPGHRHDSVGTITTKSLANSKCELSTRDARIHEIIGRLFESHTNADIATNRSVMKQLSKEFRLQRGDALKSCLDRIRRAKRYPLSKHIREKRRSSLS